MDLKRSPLSALLIAFLCIVAIACIGCRSKPKGKQPQAERKGPAAEAKQAIATPTLAPPTPPPETKAEKTPEQAEQEAPPPPRGPVTLPPAPEGTPPIAPPGEGAAGGLAGAGIAPPALAPPPAPGAAAGTEAIPAQTPPPGMPPPPETAAPQVPPAMPPAAAPLATLPGQEGGAKPPEPTGGVAALPAPDVTPPETKTKPGEAEAVPFEPKLVRGQTDIDIILDASGSMAAPFAQTNATKLDLVRQALYDVIAEMGSTLVDFPRNVGIRVFGADSPAADNNRIDSKLVVKMGSPDLAGIKGVVEKITAQGLSPLSYALTEAVKDFPPGSTGDRVIVLIADGADNTEGDPCLAVATKVETGPVKTTVHVIGFDVSPGDMEQLQCIAAKGDGKFYLARNEGELRTALDEAINSTIPYNLKLTAQAGGTPLPFELTVFRAGTDQVVRRDKSFGTKLLRLDPGTYDLLVEYADSPERKKPSKILKGVEILATTKIEQTVAFDLGQLTLSAVGNDGAPAAGRFEIARIGTSEAPMQVETGAEPTTLFLSPGMYNITSSLLESQLEGFALAEKDIPVRLMEPSDRVFRFQKGTLQLRGITTQKQLIPFIYQVYKADRGDQLIASGALPSEGGTVLVAPGTYDLIVIGTDPKMAASPRTKVSSVEIRAAATTDIVATFEMGLMKLQATSGTGVKMPALFVVRDHDTQLEMARIASESGDPITLPIPPGTYDVVASSTTSNLEPKPSVLAASISVTADKPTEQVIKFILGTLKLRGRNAKEQPIPTQFTIYGAGLDEVISTAPASSDWAAFDLAPGIYDALATNTSSDEKPQPMIWLRDLKVEDGKTISHEAIFTAGKLKIIGRGPNNQIITCTFKVFQYGKDRELINGQTGQDWEVFEIQPGKYYLEASYHDDEKSVLLKQWVNLSVGENEVVEVVLRF